MLVSLLVWLINRVVGSFSVHHVEARIMRGAIHAVSMAVGTLPDVMESFMMKDLQDGLKHCRRNRILQKAGRIAGKD